MSTVYRDHTAQIILDFGVIGEHEVDVIYDWHEPNPSNDPFQVPEKGGVVIKAVMLFIDGRDCDVKHWMSQSRMEMVTDFVLEQWR